MNEYVPKPNTGVLFNNNYKKHDKAPDFKGSIKIDKDLLIELVKNRTSELIEIKLDGWKKLDKNGKPMVSLSVDTYKKPEAQDQKDPWDQ